MLLVHVSLKGLLLGGALVAESSGTAFAQRVRYHRGNETNGALMNKQRVLETFLRMVEIDSPSCHEAAMAAYCAQRLEAAGFSVEWDSSQEATGSDTPQIIARRPGAAAGALALSAHMDCVIPCCGVKPKIVDGDITSDGTTVLGGDDKSGVAQILEAVTCIDEQNAPAPDLTVLLSVCEEQSVAGAPHFPDKLFDEENLCLVLDAEGSPLTVTLGAPYHYVFAATFHGHASHAGVEPEKGRSALSMAARAIDTMPLGRHDDCTTSSCGIIEGGRATNIVPDTIVLRGECRSLYEDRVEDLRARMDDAMKQGAIDFGGSVDVDWHLSYPGILYAQDDPDVQTMLQVAQRLGLPADCAISGGGSDANVLGSKGAKAIPLGTGMANFHALTEHLALADLENGALFVEEMIKEMAVRA